MTVELNVNFTLSQLVNGLGGDESLTAKAKALEAKNANVIFKPKQIVIEVPGGQPTVAGIHLHALKSAMAGGFGNASKQVMLVTLEKAINGAYAQLGVDVEVGITPSTDSDTTAPEEAPLEVVIFPTDKSFTKTYVPIQNKTAYANDLDATPVALSQAQKLLQPVRGTDATSVYFCIALHPELKMAARIRKDGKISVRVEGDIKKYGSMLAQADLSVSGGTHYSMHLKVDESNPVLIRKTIGAVIGATGVEWEQSTTAVDTIIGKGK